MLFRSELAKQCDVIVVIGGTHSNNTHELVKSCSQFCERVYHVQAADDLLPEWFYAEDKVGITAGTSTPDDVINSIARRLTDFASCMAAQPHQLKESNELAFRIA